MIDNRIRLLIIVISGVGFLLSLYLVLTVYGDCSASSLICRKVHNSSYAYIGGIPVAWMGVFGYLAMGATSIGRMQRLTKALTVCGFLFELRLVYAQAFEIGVFCPWCMASALLMTILLLLSFPGYEHENISIRRSLNEINYLQRKGHFHV